MIEALVDFLDFLFEGLVGLFVSLLIPLLCAVPIAAFIAVVASLI